MDDFFPKFNKRIKNLFYMESIKNNSALLIKPKLHIKYINKTLSILNPFKLVFYLFLFCLQFKPTFQRKISCDQLGLCKITYNNNKEYTPNPFEVNLNLFEDKYIKEDNYQKLYFNYSTVESVISVQPDPSVDFLFGSNKYQCADGLRECPEKCCKFGLCSDPSNVCLKHIYNRELIYAITGSIFGVFIIVYWIIYFYLGVNYNSNFSLGNNIKSLDMIYRKPFVREQEAVDKPDTEFNPHANIEEYENRLKTKEYRENMNNNMNNINYCNLDDQLVDNNNYKEINILTEDNLKKETNINIHKNSDNQLNEIIEINNNDNRDKKFLNEILENQSSSAYKLKSEFSSLNAGIDNKTNNRNKRFKNLDFNNKKLIKQNSNSNSNDIKSQNIDKTFDNKYKIEESKQETNPEKLSNNNANICSTVSDINLGSNHEKDLVMKKKDANDLDHIYSAKKNKALEYEKIRDEKVIDNNPNYSNDHLNKQNSFLNANQNIVNDNTSEAPIKNDNQISNFDNQKKQLDNGNNQNKVLEIEDIINLEKNNSKEKADLFSPSSFANKQNRKLVRNSLNKNKDISSLPIPDKNTNLKESEIKNIYSEKDNFNTGNEENLNLVSENNQLQENKQGKK